MSSSGEEDETYGPKKGIKLSLEQANIITNRHLNTSALSISHIKRGYNNRVYIVSTSDDREVVLRLSGRFWTRYKTENEVCALSYLTQACPAVPVPKILGFCTDKSASGINAEYILMEKVKGEVLEHVWNASEVHEKKKIVDQLVTIFAGIQKVRFSQIGSFQLKNQDSNGLNLKDLGVEDVVIGKGVEFEGGPCDSYMDYLRTSSETEIWFLKRCPFMQEAEGYAERLGRIEKFVASFTSLDTVSPALREGVEAAIIPFVFCHGDFEPRNIMIDKETLKVSGILDWEFSGSCPVDEDWFTGFRFVGSDTSEWRVFNEGEGNPGNEPEVGKSLRAYFLERMKENGVSIPDTIPDHMTRSELYYFKGFICPWWLREEKDPIPESHFSDRENACKRVDGILEKYGF